MGCSPGGPKSDLNMVRNKIKPGMSELEVTRDAGAPSHIDVQGDVRKLRYDSTEGHGSVTVTLRQNIVTDVVSTD